MKKTLFLVSTFLFLSINFLAKSSEQNLLDTLYFEDLMETCIPINTDGKARCARLQLIRILYHNEFLDY